jgi:hypothetical protein
MWQGLHRTCAKAKPLQAMALSVEGKAFAGNGTALVQQGMVLGAVMLLLILLHCESLGPSSCGCVEPALAKL